MLGWFSLGSKLQRGFQKLVSDINLTFKEKGGIYLTEFQGPKLSANYTHPSATTEPVRAKKTHDDGQQIDL